MIGVFDQRHAIGISSLEITMTSQTENTKSNVFSFSNPDELECVVEDHNVSHSVMHIKIFDPMSRESRILEFQLVHYFSGPLSWTGANFQIRPWQECVELLRALNKMQHLNDMTLEMQREIGEKHFHLYTISAVNPKMEIRILAGSGQIK